MRLSFASRSRDSLSHGWQRALALVMLILATTASAAITYEYDNAGRLRKVTYDDGMVVTYGLDAAGNRTTVTKQVQAGGTLQFSSATYSVGEAGPTATITVSRVGNTTGAVGVTYATSNGTANAGSDYSAATSTLSWASGDSASKTFTVAIINDTAVESSETVNLTLSAPTGGATLGSPSTAVLTITDNDVAVPGSIQFSAASYSVGEAGPSVTITATRTGGSSGAVAVTYATSNGTATAGSDYTAASSTLSWASGDTSAKTFTVAIINDTAVESSETVNLTLSAPTGGATLGSPSTAVLTITDNDTLPAGTLQFSTSTYAGGEPLQARNITVIVTRTGGSFGAVSVPFTVTGVTATAGSDYTAVASGTLTWANGNAAAQAIGITVLDDSLFEAVESITVTLGTPSGTTLGSPSTATVTIGSDDAPPPPGTIQFTTSSTSVAENGTSITLTASRVNGSFGAVGASYSTANGTATAGADYTATSSTLSWADGDTANKSFTVTILDDSALEGAETFTAALSAPTGGASLGATPTITVTIADNENPPAGTLQFSTSTYAGGEPLQARNITVIVTRTGGSFGAVSVPYTVTGVTATAGSDYTAVASGTLTWANGNAAAQAIGITVLDDSLFEAVESITVTLGTPSGTTLGSPGTATVTIGSDDAPPPPGTIQFTTSSTSVAENGTSITLTASRVNGSFGAVGASYSTANGTATAGADYTATSGTLSWADGDTANKSFTVSLLDDGAAESGETFSATLSAPSGGASLGGTPAITVTINDNDAPSATISISDMTVFAEGFGFAVQYYLTPGGDILATNNAAVNVDVGDWLVPKTGMSLFEVLATYSVPPGGESFCEGTLGSWLDLGSTAAAWRTYVSGPDQNRFCDITLQIRAKGNPSVILDTARIRIEQAAGL